MGFYLLMIELDGSYGEGGGQIVRTALALSTLTGKAFHVCNIRKGRDKPGLKAQHVTAVNALKEMCGAETSLVDIGVEELTFTPGKMKGGNYSFDIGTAGSITLLLQALLLPMLFAPKKITLTLKGGTCGKWQAPVEYFQNVLLPFLGKFGKVECKLLKRGYFPKGGGEVRLVVVPKYSSFDGLDFTFDLVGGELMQIKGISHAAKELSSAKVAERQADAARLELGADVPVSIISEYDETLSVGSGITLWARFNKNDEFHSVVGADALGEKGKPAEKVGREAALELKKVIGNGLDKYLADQLVPFVALVGGKFVAAEITEHCRTNGWVVETFIARKFTVEGDSVSVTSS
jgi:RNA 3'-phosphate cyclase